MTPSAACVLQKELGLAEDTVCFDLNAACAGFVYGLHTAECLLAASERKYGLVIGCEVLSRITTYRPFHLRAVRRRRRRAVVQWGEDYPSLCAVMAAAATAKCCIFPASTPAPPVISTWDGKEVFRFAVEVLPRCAKRWRPRPASPWTRWTLCVPPGQPAHPGPRHQKAEAGPRQVRRQHCPHRQYLGCQRPHFAGRAGQLGPAAQRPAGCCAPGLAAADLGRRSAAACLTACTPEF